MRPIGKPKQRRIDKRKKKLRQLEIDHFSEVAQDREKLKEVCFVTMSPLKLLIGKMRKKMHYYLSLIIFALLISTFNIMFV